MPSNIKYDLQTYDEIKAELIARIPEFLPEWTDTRDTDMGVVILELLAYLGDMLSFKINRAVDESFLYTAQREESVYNTAKGLGYSFRGKLPASCFFVCVLSEVRGEDTIISAGARISNITGDIVFETTEELTIPAGKLGNEMTSGEYLYKVTGKNQTSKEDVVLGSVEARTDGTMDFIEFNFNEINVIRSSVTVQVYNGASWEDWTVVDTLAFSGATTKEVKLEIDELGEAKLVFGNDTTGKIPDVGDSNVRVSYSIGGGVSANDLEVGEIDSLLESISYVASIGNVTKPSGGADEETIETIRETLPQRWARMHRAVTQNDFEAIALDYGMGKAKTVASGSLVSMYVLDSSNAVVSQEDKDALKLYIEERMLIGNTITINDPYVVDIVLAVTINVLPGYDLSTVCAAVKAELEATIFSDTTLTLGATTRLSDVYAAIEAVEGVDFSTITQMHRTPYIRPDIEATGRLVAELTLGTGSLSKVWTVEMQSASDYIISDGSQSYSHILGEEYTLPTGGSEITVKLTAGEVACLATDVFYIRTSAYVGDIYAENLEILNIESGSIVIT